MLDLLRPIVSDMDLVRDELPTQALARIDAARALIAYIDNDPETAPKPKADPTLSLGALGPLP